MTLFSALAIGRRPSSRQALIAVAVVLAVLLTAFRGYGWYADYRAELDQTIALKTTQLEKLERVAAGAQDFEKEKSRLEALIGALDARLVKGSTRSLSEAMAQNLVQELAQKAKVEIRTMKVLPAAAKDGLVFLNLSINGKGEIGAIKDLLEQVQTNRQYLFFRELEIKQVSASERRFYYINAKLSALTE